MDKLQKRIASMLTENTGRHMLDSGGAYGRHWERNQGVDFEKTPMYSIDVWKDEIDVTVSVYHWLYHQLGYDEYCDELQKEFEEFSKSPEYKEEYWLSCIEGFIEKTELKDGSKRFEIIFSENTYNGESVLSQVLQYTSFIDRKDDTQYVLLQIHNGADVRGGYTAPKVFKLANEGYLNETRWDSICACQEVSHEPGYSEEDVDWIYAVSDKKIFCKRCLMEVDFRHLDRKPERITKKEIEEMISLDEIEEEEGKKIIDRLENNDYLEDLSNTQELPFSHND
jgi:hypothetical protein